MSIHVPGTTKRIFVNSITVVPVYQLTQTTIKKKQYLEGVDVYTKYRYSFINRFEFCVDICTCISK